MHWNHRVISKQVPADIKGNTETAYEIHEVYYNEEGIPTSCTVDGITAFGETVEELKETLERMLKATEKPILEMSYFVNLPKEEIDWEKIEDDSEEDDKAFFDSLLADGLIPMPNIENGDYDTGC